MLDTIPPMDFRSWVMLHTTNTTIRTNPGLTPTLVLPANDKRVAFYVLPPDNAALFLHFGLTDSAVDGVLIHRNTNGALSGLRNPYLFTIWDWGISICKGVHGSLPGGSEQVNFVDISGEMPWTALLTKYYKQLSMPSEIVKEQRAIRGTIARLGGEVRKLRMGQLPPY